MKIEKIITILIALLTLTNTFGNIPMFLTITETLSDKIKRKISIQTSIYIFIILIITYIFGSGVLSIFGISNAAFRFAGGVLVFSIALNMVRGETPLSKNSRQNLQEYKEENDESHTYDTSMAIVPLAMPIYVGPGTMSAVILYESSVEFSSLELIIAIFLTSLIVLITLLTSKTFSKALGKIGLNIMGRLIGLISLGISIQMMFGALKEYFFQQ